jgi:hypothetical protein
LANILQVNRPIGQVDAPSAGHPRDVDTIVNNDPAGTVRKLPEEASEELHEGACVQIWLANLYQVGPPVERARDLLQ